jgi:hypothetical protein
MEHYMNAEVTQPKSPWRYLWLIALLALPIFGWLGILDEYSSANLTSSISNAGLIYGTARGINALVSLLQGTEVGVVFITFSIGEVLDPINDLIERFSQILLIALGSLALQKILLTIVSHTMFNVLLSIAAVCSGITLFLNRPRLLSTCLRLFLVIAFFRFSLGLVVLANAWVDSTFLHEADQGRHTAMEGFRSELREINALTQEQRDAAQHIAKMQASIAKIDQSYKRGKLVLEKIDTRIKTDTTKLKELIDHAGPLCISWDIIQRCPDKVKHEKAKLKNKEEKRSVLFESLEHLQDLRDDAREEIACIEKRVRGENCKFWDRIPDAPDIEDLRRKMGDINADIGGFSENTIDLLVSLLLKTVAIPLLFIYLLLRVIRTNWTRI